MWLLAGLTAAAASCGKITEAAADGPGDAVDEKYLRPVVVIVGVG